jgi:hypothetical protein
VKSRSFVVLLLLSSVSCFVSVEASAQALNAARQSEQKILKAYSLPLGRVRLLGGPLKVAQDQDAKYRLICPWILPTR